MSKVPLEASGCDPRTGASRYWAPAASIWEAMLQLSFGPARRHTHRLNPYCVVCAVCSVGMLQEHADIDIMSNDCSRGKQGGKNGEGVGRGQGGVGGWEGEVSCNV